jgi:predicted HicB family RNase H-like nuclease
MEYDGYIAEVEYAPEYKVFHGIVVNILDTVTFESRSAKRLEREFHKSVDEYVAFCRERGQEPERPY